MGEKEKLAPPVPIHREGPGESNAISFYYKIIAKNPKNPSLATMQKHSFPGRLDTIPTLNDSARL
jgi:hypothetical protein